MKGLIRNVFVNFLSIFLAARLIPAINYKDSLVVLFWAALFLTVLNFLVKPILNLLLMPINLITLGAFRWVINVVVLFLVTFFVSGFGIKSFNFAGLNLGGFVIPAIHFSLFLSLILLSFVIEITVSFLNWIFS